MARLFLFYALLLCFFTACGQAVSSEGQELITWQTYEALNEAQPDWQVIDVRTPEEFGEGQLENAVNIDFYADDFEAQLEQLDKTRPVVVYCKRGGRSNKAAARCKALGFEKVYDIKGGYDAWKALEKDQ
jgi:rhodanese-related sulfurtransferase